MKAVILAGGKGTRMREETEYRPKPMVEIGGRPIIWHIMKHFSLYGIRDFIVASGYKSEFIKDYFLNYDARTNDFTICLGDRNSLVSHGDHAEANWSVTVANTGDETPTGGRVHRITPHAKGEALLVTYGDGVADVDIEALLQQHYSSGKLATMTLAKPSSRFGVVEIGPDDSVVSMREKPQLADWVNIGYFVFEPAALDFFADDSVLEVDVLAHLASVGQLSAFRHGGFWQPMDTYKEAQYLSELCGAGETPWLSRSSRS